MADFEPKSERRPSDRSWVELPMPAELRAQYHRASAWQSGPIRVVSSLQHAEAPDGNGECWQWLVSISDSGRRPKPHHVRRALRAFNMAGADNDAHHPGNAVHFWMPCDPERRVACQCKTDEDTIVEPDGYRWTNPKEGPCRGCELEEMMAQIGIAQLCPIHRSMTGEMRAL